MPVTHVHGSWAIQVQFSNDGRKRFSVTCGSVTRDNFNSLDDATGFLDMVDHAAHECLVFCDALDPYEGYLSEWNYSDHMTAMRELIFGDLEKACAGLFEACYEYRDNCDGGTIDGDVAAAFNNAGFALRDIAMWHDAHNA